MAQPPSGGSHAGGHVHLQIGLQLGRLDELLRLPFQRRPQALVVQDAGAQVGDDAAQVQHRRVDLPPHALAFGQQRRRVAQAARQPVGVHLQRHQLRAQLVVDLARDARALLLAHRLGMVGALAQPRQRIAELARALAHARLELVVGLAQQRFGPLALADVDKADHRAHRAPLVQQRVAGVLGLEGRAVGAPQHLVVDAAGLAHAEGLEDRAVALGVVPPVRMGVVHQLVHVAAQHRFGAVAQQPQGRRVDEGAAAGQVDGEDAFADAVQQQRVGVGSARFHGGARRNRRATGLSCCRGAVPSRGARSAWFAK